jgi:hypothetical protein
MRRTGKERVDVRYLLTSPAAAAAAERSSSRSSRLSRGASSAAACRSRWTAPAPAAGPDAPAVSFVVDEEERDEAEAEDAARAREATGVVVEKAAAAVGSAAAVAAVLTKGAPRRTGPVAPPPTAVAAGRPATPTIERTDARESARGRWARPPVPPSEYSLAVVPARGRFGGLGGVAPACCWGGSTSEAGGATARAAKERGVGLAPSGRTAIVEGLAVMLGLRRLVPLLEATDPLRTALAGGASAGLAPPSTSTEEAWTAPVVVFSSAAAAAACSSTVRGIRWCSACEPRARAA